MMFLDVSSAFDTVDHDIMLSILHRRFSVEGMTLKWFHLYMTDRSQTFSVGHSKSDCHRASCSVPQGSVLGPVEFVAYTEDTCWSVDRHKLNHHLYAVRWRSTYLPKIYLHTESGLASTRLTSLATCFSDLSNWCACRWLLLNALKTELIWFGSRSTLRHLTGDNHSLSIGSVTVKSVDVVRGVLQDSELTMKQHIIRVVSISYYHLHRLKQLRRHITQDAMKQLVCSLILSRIYYCNSILISLPVSSIAPLQLLQNVAARLVMCLCARNHVSSSLAGLHWLPILYRIQYKVALTMFFINTNQCPAYLGNIVTPLIITLTSRLCSSTGNLLPDSSN